MSSTRTHASVRVLLCCALATALFVSTVGTAGARTTSASTTKCKKTSGDPVLLSTISNETEPLAQLFYKPAVIATAKAINCEGGIQGRPLKMVTCNGNPYTDPNNGVNCARQAIEQGVVGSAALASNDAAIAQTFVNAGVPMVGVALNIVGLTNALSFNVTSGAPGIVAGPVANMWDNGARHIRILVFEGLLAAAVNGFANAALKPRGGTMLEPVQYPTDTGADDSAVIQAAVSGADALFLGLNATTNIKVIPEIRAAGFKGPIAMAATLAEPSVMKAIGASEAKKLILSAGLYPATAKQHAGIRQFNKDMDRFGPKVPRIDGSINGWESVRVIADALNHAPTIDKAALLTALNSYQITFDASPDVNLGNGGGQFGIPRIFTTLTSLQAYRNGKYYTKVDFFDPLAAPTSDTTKKK